jgi:hypothetical protein
MSKLHEDDVKARLQVDFIDEEGASVDIRLSTTEEILVRKPDDSRVTFVASVDVAATVTITRVGEVATVIRVDHLLNTGQKVEILGVTESDYNGVFEVIKIDRDTFTYPVTGSPATPATGAPTSRPINRIFYDTIVNDVDQAGDWEVQGRVVLPSGEDWASDPGIITVEKRFD